MPILISILVYLSSEPLGALYSTRGEGVGGGIKFNRIKQHLIQGRSVWIPVKPGIEPKIQPEIQLETNRDLDRDLERFQTKTARFHP
jgi:hypothetical protein